MSTIYFQVVLKKNSVYTHTYKAPLISQMIKHLPANAGSPSGDQVQSLGQEDPLEEEMATHSSILAWEIPWTKEPGRLWSMESPRVRHNLATEKHKQQHNSRHIE